MKKLTKSQAVKAVVFAITAAVVGTYAVSEIKQAAINENALKVVTAGCQTIICEQSVSDNLTKLGIEQGEVVGKAFVIKVHGQYKGQHLGPFIKKSLYAIGNAKPQDKIIINVESGGGAAYECTLMHDMTKQLKSTGAEIISVTDVVSASCGYMTTLESNKIYASTAARVGSIGTISYYRGKPQKGVVSNILGSKGEYECISDRELKKYYGGCSNYDEKIAKKDVIDSNRLAAESFRQLVRDSREITDESKAFAGKAYTSQEALSIGLIDEIKSSTSLYLELHKAGYEIVELK